MVKINTENVRTLALGWAFALVTGTFVNYLMNNDSKAKACQPIMEDIKQAATHSDLFNRLQGLEYSGSVSIVISYQGNSSDFKQLPFIGNNNCRTISSTLDLSASN